MGKSEWAGTNSEVARYVRAESKRTLHAYSAQPSLVDEQANQEQDTARGGYANRQVVELVQNSADQLAKAGGGRILLRLNETHMYCADNGAPLDEEGARALLFSHLSPKRDTAEIGRFGVGFKSVLRITDSPAVFSRSGSIQFDRARSKQRMERVAPKADQYPVLRVAEAIDPRDAADADVGLRELMDWAVNVVRLPLKPGTYEDLRNQFESFRAEFLLFVPHVQQLDLSWQDRDGQESERPIRLIESGGEFKLSDGSQASQWRVFEREHQLSPRARADSRALDDAERVRIAWAAPRMLRGAGQEFWAYFPTQSSSLLAGILNAPWKTNEDRQNLLPGVYNDELVDAAASLVVDNLHHLRSDDQPAQHLDYLPRRYASGDLGHEHKLRASIYRRLECEAVIPNQLGVLLPLADVHVPPGVLTPGQRIESEIVQLWSSYRHRPSDWLHDDALVNERLSTIARIADGGRTERGSLLRESVATWLQALVGAGAAHDDSVDASATAIAIASMMRKMVVNGASFGNVVLTNSGDWVPPIPDQLFLGSGEAVDPASTVHTELMGRSNVVQALRTLGIRPPSAESALRGLAANVAARDDRNDAQWLHFWQLSREVEPAIFRRTINEHFQHRPNVRVRTLEGTWEPADEVLLPGTIVSPEGDDEPYVIVDTEFHHDDSELLSWVGVVDRPRNEYPLSGAIFENYRDRKREEFRQRSKANPQPSYLNFNRSVSAGPLNVLQYLASESKARFTHVLLDLDSTYSLLKMSHDTQDRYQPQWFWSPAIEEIKARGQVAIGAETYPLADGLGDNPKNPEVRRWLMQHPKTHQIRKAFGISVEITGNVEPAGEDESAPLVDVWPGLGRFLAPEHAELQLVRCDGILDRQGADLHSDFVLQNGTCYVMRKTDEREELRAVIRELALEIDSAAVERILRRETPEDVKREREAVRAKETDAERLLQAVGEQRLRSRLPDTLVEILELASYPFRGVRVAEAAIATFHTGALRTYRYHLARLDPPHQWTGGPRTLKFVRELGFSDEWAGSPQPKRPRYEEVMGPRALPELHQYQRTAVDNVKSLLHESPLRSENRGLLSLPTGSGKTRVAVQAIIEAIRDNEFDGSVLWVADRDELCEQAVEAWQQAWASIGPEAEPLRITRLWGSQPPPEVLPRGANVIVATIQTLRARMEQNRRIAVYLGSEVGTLVVDEAHGSIAPSYTSLMGEVGLTFRRHSGEIPLLGLTATPYRGVDEEETARLVNRYGQNRLDRGVFRRDDPEEVIRQLQDMEVLARVDHDVIVGLDLQLNEEDLTRLRRTNLLSGRGQELLAADAARTQRIVDAYLNRVYKIESDAPTLIFATSVKHAETVAALLQLRGVEARAVSGGTDRAVRRSVVEEFRAGKVKVLVNYGVFREGFDAPKTRVIIVARPVYSPNLYFQMIGRGLRGELNGGSDRCLILDVHDNVVNFERQLAYTELEGLWD